MANLIDALKPIAHDALGGVLTAPLVTCSILATLLNIAGGLWLAPAPLGLTSLFVAGMLTGVLAILAVEQLVRRNIV